MRGDNRVRVVSAVVLAAAGLFVSAHALAATMQIVDRDADGEGLNDTTAVAPVGGNTGKTRGAQRRIALQYAADILGSRLASAVPIKIAASFDALGCAANEATLGQTTPAFFAVNFPHAPHADTLYPVALANALAGQRLAADSNDIDAAFNSALDDGSGCLQGARWYYGLDGARARGQINFVSAAVHELIHGLGFISEVALRDSKNASVGQFPLAGDGRRLPDIFSRFIQDLSMPGAPLWVDISDAQRARSLTNGPNVVWSDANTDSQASTLLTAGLNQGRVELFAPATIEPGSSISHWDPSLSPNQIMEPFAARSNDVTSGIGLSACVLENLGWQLANDIRCPDTDSAAIAGVAPARPSADNSGKQADAAAPASSASSSDGGGGGGCTIAPDVRFDPVWMLLTLAAALVLIRRRRYAR